MYINVDKNVQSISEYIFPMLKKICSYYPYVIISDDFVNSFLLDKIQKNIKKIKDVDHFAEFVKKSFIRTMKGIIKESLENDDTCIDFIKKYISYSCKVPTNVNDAIELFDKIDNFFNHYDFILSKGNITKLINSNVEIKTALEIIYKTYKEESKSKLNNELVINFLDIYCELYNLQLNDLGNIDVVLANESDDNMESPEFDFDDYYYDDLVKEIIVKAGQYPLLTDDEQKALLQRVAEGDSVAKDILVERNARLVISIVRKNLGKGVDFLDLYQEGCIGLMQAIDKFDITRDNALSTYSVWWIKQKIKRYIANNARNIRLPVKDIEKINKISAIQNKFSLEYNREPSLEELAELTQLSVEKVVELLNDKDTISLNIKINEDSEELEVFQMSEDISLEEQAANKDLSRRIKLLMDTLLTEKEAKVIMYRYGLNGDKPKTLEEIGQLLDVSRERIRQIEKSAMEILQSPLAIGMLQKSLEAPSNEVKRFNCPQEQRREDLDNKSLYAYFAKYSKHLIDKIIATLHPKEIMLLKLRYGERLLYSKCNSLWTLENQEELAKLMSKIEHLFDREMKNTPRVVSGFKTIYYYLEDYSKLEVDDAIDQLSVKDSLFLTSIFGNDFSNPTFNPDISSKIVNSFYQIKSKIVSILKGKSKTIYKVFWQYSKEQVDNAISCLSEKEKNIIAIKFGPDLSKAKKSAEWQSGYHSELNYIKKKIAKILADKYPLGNNELELEEINNFKEKYEEPYCNVDYKDLEVSCDVSTPIFKYILSVMPRLEVMILEMKYGVRGSKYSIEEIADALNISEIDIIKMLKNALNRYKDIFDGLVSNLDQNPLMLVLAKY